MNVCPYTNNNWNTLPHIILVSYDEWDPTILDYSIDDDAADNGDWYDEISDISTRHNDKLFDSTGEYKYIYVIYGIDINNHNFENRTIPNDSLFYSVHDHDSYNIEEHDNTDT